MDETDPDLIHILVIDDDEDLRRLLSEILSLGGHQIVTAGSAEEGLAFLPYYTFQVAFLDQQLPGMEGARLAEFLRKNNPDMRIALVTGGGDSRLFDRMEEEHDVVVIQKPFTASQILDQVTAYQAAAAERQEARRRTMSPDYGPPLSRFLGEIASAFEIPAVPKRAEDRLIATVKQCLNNLRSVARYNERDRVAAFAGLVAMQVLGIHPPKSSAGRTLFEEYDALMVEHGRRPEFGR